MSSASLTRNGRPSISRPLVALITVASARVITDRDTGRSRGFGFVEMDVDDVATVISATNGREIDGRPLRVNEAEDKGGSGGGRRDSRGPRERY